ncbi:MAG: hypothetical protein ABIT37_21475 [Luteolibacter sp.]
MGAILTINGPDFDAATWQIAVGNLIWQRDQPGVSPLCMVFNEELAEVFPEAGSSEPTCLGDDGTWLHSPGAIRGVTVRRFADGSVSVSLPSGAGRGDWEFAARLGECGMASGAELEVDGETVVTAGDGSVDLTKLFEKQWEFETSMIRQLASDSDDKSIDLPVLGNLLKLKVTADDAASDAFHDDLTERMRRYSEAHVASTMSVRTETGAELEINVAGAVPTLIAADVDALMLFDAPAAMEASDALFGKKLVPLGPFLEVMRNEVEVLGGLNYVPLFKYSEHPEVMSKLQAAVDAYEPGGAGDLTETDLNALSRGPVLVFLLVAAADGSVDKKEILEFGAILSKAAALPGSIFQKMLATSIVSQAEILQQVMASGEAPLAQLVQLLQALEKCPAGEADLIRNGLYVIAYRIANASGGFLGFGSKISPGEQRALDMLKTLLGVNPGELNL